MLALGVIVLIVVICTFLNEKLTPTLTAEHWANKELINRDRMSGMSEKEIVKNAERGKYYIKKGSE